MLTGLKLQTALNYFKFGRDDTPSASVENSSIYVNKITLYCANRVKITNSSELFQDGEEDETHHHHLLKFLQFM